ncbi:alcohol dehydrogenase, catalytic domain, GroES-like family [Leptospira inadai serovar Lyme str. 10]|uniref:Alcohol dehydrogenase, catalytic domain, GroES-like family n=2 Tax=Leptospira inadai serovar Lyme TaxID=293084 RepID=V6H8P0_9LEPT|nr:alcohol dehydrogenase catalytic domain-containing protein [Leptospira inadai]EQA35152.1 alcohol dehydrogenase, catalytic domain, GroES-like family [Leptospira inadai serovar Lyme str. 10]PNV75426.1 zinc-binding alcohol dehydrogenase [Leptospira inadai serovar Lyme]
METVQFSAFDYNRDDTFSLSEYRLEGSENGGWKIFRNQDLYLSLGKGYKLLKTKLCGICSTDLDRRFLPFTLPQIIGHEVLATDPTTGKKFVLEINDTVAARGEEEDSFCKRGLQTHSPSRLVLGIDRLPGGFGKFLLAPVGTLVEVDTLEDREAILLEPFAASLHGVEVSLANSSDKPKRIAVLGPRRLGSLLLAGLELYRRRNNLDYKIVAVLRRRELKDTSFGVGADEVLVFPELSISSRGSFKGERYYKESSASAEEISWDNLLHTFDIVFDTTGAIEGLELSMDLTHKEIHRKTTNGQGSLGISNLTELVVDELSILPLQKGFQNLSWGVNSALETWVFLEAGIRLSNEEQAWIDIAREEGIRFYSGSIQEGESFLQSQEFTGDLRRFDFAILKSASSVDLAIRPGAKEDPSLLRPRGFILIPAESGISESNPFLHWVIRGGVLRSSRCGDFRRTLSFLEQEKGFLKNVSAHLLGEEFSALDLPKAYEEARKPTNIKVIVRHDP